MYRHLLTRRAVLALTALALGACQSVTGPASDPSEARAAKLVTPQQTSRTRLEVVQGSGVRVASVIKK